MQLFALDEKGQSESVEKAERGRDYWCSECEGVVRIREGIRLQRHYYHLRRAKECRQNGKGQVHLQVQHHLLNSLPAGEASMEVRFPEINRIADVAWEAEGIVFEVQCAPMSAEEALERTADYGKLGWQVVWILHTSRYGGFRLSGMEAALKKVPHYYTDIEEKGVGTIFDQLTLYRNGRRLAALPRCPVQLQRGEALALSKSIATPQQLPSLISDRAAAWSLHLAGDYLDMCGNSAVFAPLLAAEYRHEAIFNTVTGSLWQRCCLRPYRILLQWILERYCFR